MSTSLLTVVETSAFARRAEKLLTNKEYETLIFYVVTHREKGDEIPALAVCASFGMRRRVGASPAE